jgi:hypothetical protein
MTPVMTSPHRATIVLGTSLMREAGDLSARSGGRPSQLGYGTGFWFKRFNPSVYDPPAGGAIGDASFASHLPKL